MKYSSETVTELGGNVEYSSEALLARAEGILRMTEEQFKQRVNYIASIGNSIIEKEEIDIANSNKKRRKGRR